MRSSKPRFFAFALAAAAVLLTLCACGGMRWHKSDGNDAELAKDMAACRNEAQGRVGPTTALGQSAGYDPRFGAPPGPSQSDAMMQVSQAAGLCMRSRGYVLVPDTK